MGESDRNHWNERWAGRTVGSTANSSMIELVGPWLPAAGRALDVAGGGSGDSLALAERGLDVTVTDVSDVGLDIARRRATAAGHTITTVCVDLETDPLPPGPWDVICVANYSNRELFAGLDALLREGGVLAIVLATVANLERNERPSRRHLVEPGEILAFAPDLEVLHHSEAWRPNGRHEAHLIATTS